MYCTRCHNEIAPGKKFCGHCGAEVPEEEVKYCSFCGKPLTPSKNFCGSCGTPTGGTTTGGRGGIVDPPPEGGTGATPHKKKAKMTPLIIIAAVAAVALLFVFVGLPLITKPYLEPARMLAKALEESDTRLIDRAIAPNCLGDINRRMDLTLLTVKEGCDEWYVSIMGESKLDKRELEDLTYYFSEEFEGARPSAGYYVEMTASAYSAGTGEMTYGYVWMATVVKLNGVWYICDLDTDGKLVNSGGNTASASGSGGGAPQGGTPQGGVVEQGGGVAALRSGKDDHDEAANMFVGGDIVEGENGTVYVGGRSDAIYEVTPDGTCRELPDTDGHILSLNYCEGALYYTAGPEIRRYLLDEQRMECIYKDAQYDAPLHIEDGKIITLAYSEDPMHEYECELFSIDIETGQKSVIGYCIGESLKEHCHIDVADGWVYYFALDMNMVNNMISEGDTDNGMKAVSLVRSRLDGSGRTVLLTSCLPFFNIYNGRIYIASYSDGMLTAVEMALDGTDIKYYESCDADGVWQIDETEFTTALLLALTIGHFENGYYYYESGGNVYRADMSDMNSTVSLALSMGSDNYFDAYANGYVYQIKVSGEFDDMLAISRISLETGYKEVLLQKNIYTG